LAQAGYVENRNVVIEWQFLDGKYDRLQTALAELVDRQVAVIAVPGATALAIAAKAATQRVPVVFMVGSDPVDVGLVASLAKPGGNLTGVFVYHAPMIAKRVELLHQLTPNSMRIGLLTNPNNPVFSEAERKGLEHAAKSLGLELLVAGARDQREIDACIPALVDQGARAIVIGADTFFFTERDQIAALAKRYMVPTIGGWSEYPIAGGLMSYATNNDDAHALVGKYVGRILDGETPADMPVQQVTKFELVVNIGVAKAIGLTIPDKLLALVDKVVE
jgi:putative ABC transport system substrate-binding protein